MGYPYTVFRRDPTDESHDLQNVQNEKASRAGATYGALDCRQAAWLDLCDRGGKEKPSIEVC